MRPHARLPWLEVDRIISRKHSLIHVYPQKLAVDCSTSPKRANSTGRIPRIPLKHELTAPALVLGNGRIKDFIGAIILPPVVLVCMIDDGSIAGDVGR